MPLLRETGRNQEQIRWICERMYQVATTVDVGAKGEFYKLLSDLKNAGTAIILYSSDDEEQLGLCDRIIVLQDGQVQAELADKTLTRSELVAASMGSVRGGA